MTVPQHRLLAKLSPVAADCRVGKTEECGGSGRAAAAAGKVGPGRLVTLHYLRHD
jgi:hypothetical protein